jgi:anti-sigma regulatory factor (Ser/Thr protein kinase)
VDIEPGDTFVFYSDGITEARNLQGEFFGVEGLEACVRRNAQNNPSALVDTVRKTVIEYSGTERPNDDFTCVVIQMAGVGGERVTSHRTLDMYGNLSQLEILRYSLRGFCIEAFPDSTNSDLLYSLEIAVNEAAANIVKHSYVEQKSGGFRVKLEATENLVRVLISHNGTAFNPTAVRLPSLDGSQENGFGVYLISQCVDEAGYFSDQSGEHYVSLMKRFDYGGRNYGN